MGEDHIGLIRLAARLLVQAARPATIRVQSRREKMPESLNQNLARTPTAELRVQGGKVTGSITVVVVVLTLVAVPVLHRQGWRSGDKIERDVVMTRLIFFRCRAAFNQVELAY